MSDEITFWLGCNVLRHGDIIHACIEILKRLDVDAVTVGGPSYCCGTVRNANVTASGGMGKRNSSKLNDIGREKVIAWCPACYIQSDRFIKNFNESDFTVSHITGLLYGKRERLRALLTNRVERRVVLHQHHSPERELPVNSIVPELLRMIPGVELIDTDAKAPSYMCTDALVAVPEAMGNSVAALIKAAEDSRADTVVTIHHPCQTHLCALEKSHNFKVVNYVVLLAEAMGLEFSDHYKTWRNSDEEIHGAVGYERIQKAGAELFERTILPELTRKRLA